MLSDTIQETRVWDWLNEIPDPEIPVISVVELGVIRKVDIKSEDEIAITITPTYSGCPAMNVFEADIISKLNEKGFSKVNIITVLSPAWTTDWIEDKTLDKLKAYGIAPPIKGTEDKGLLFQSGPKVVHCPKCGNENTNLTSQFGSTACKALYSCNNCKEPFEYFKCI